MINTYCEQEHRNSYPNKAGDCPKQDMSPARCSTSWGGQKRYVHGGNSASNVRHGPKPSRVPFFGAGISFSKCHANLLVPYDPYLAFMFGGEEYNRAVRLYTHGYDLYAPTKNYAYHYYDDEKKPSQANGPRKRGFFSNTAASSALQDQATTRWRTILGLERDQPGAPVPGILEDIRLFGLGNRRTLREFELFSGVDLHAKTMVSRCPFLHKLPWIPTRYLPGEDLENDGPGHYHPAGPACVQATATGSRCCMTMDLVRDNAAQMLELSNEAYAKQVASSGKVVESAGRSVLLNPVIGNAQIGKCPVYGTRERVGLSGSAPRAGGLRGATRVVAPEEESQSQGPGGASGASGDQDGPNDVDFAEAEDDDVQGDGDHGNQDAEGGSSTHDEGDDPDEDDGSADDYDEDDDGDGDGSDRDAGDDSDAADNVDTRSGSDGGDDDGDKDYYDEDEANDEDASQVQGEEQEI